MLESLNRPGVIHPPVLSCPNLTQIAPEFDKLRIPFAVRWPSPTDKISSIFESTNTARRRLSFGATSGLPLVVNSTSSQSRSAAPGRRTSLVRASASFPRHRPRWAQLTHPFCGKRIPGSSRQSCSGVFVRTIRVRLGKIRLRADARDLEPDAVEAGPRGDV